MQHRTTLAGLAARTVGAGLLVATGDLHLDLYLTGYRTIPTIGWLFLLQVVTAFVLALAVLVSGASVAAIAGALFAVATLGGYVLSMWTGLFGFKEVRTTAGVVAGILEVCAFAVLAAVAITGAHADRSVAVVERALAAGGGHAASILVGAPSLAAAAILAAALATPGAAASSSGTATTRLAVTTIGRVRVLTNARGLTLYWFGPDSPNASHCYGDCAAYWPPVLGRPTALAGLGGRPGTVRRQGGVLQATYDGHPLYTFLGDTAKGQNHGNEITLNGGEWFEMTSSGSRP